MSNQIIDQLNDDEAERLLARLKNKKKTKKSTSRIQPADRSGHLPLSFAQQRLWFLAQMDGGSEAYHVPGGIKLRGNFDKAALCKALETIQGRHESLRTTFKQVDGQPIQFVSPSSTFQLREQTITDETELDQIVAEEYDAPFDLENGPLVRGRLIKESDDLHTLLLTMHHIISDGWSMGLLVSEFSQLYQEYTGGEAASLPTLEIQYPDYAVWQRHHISGEVLAKQEAYWKNAFAGAPSLLELPTDFPRPSEQTFEGANLEFGLEGDLVVKLKELSAKHHTTLFMTLMSAWAALLSRLSGQKDIVVGTPSANRGRQEIQSLIGFFINTLALRVELTDTMTVSELLEQVRKRSLDAQASQDIPFERVVELAKPLRSLAYNPLFQVMFVWQSFEKGTLELPGLTLEPLKQEHHTVSKFDLTLVMEEETSDEDDENQESSIDGIVEYSTALFKEDTILRFTGCFIKLLEGMVANPAERIDRIAILPDEERLKVVEQWNATTKPFQDSLCFHEIFETQAAATPNGRAIVSPEGAMTFGELNASANQLAHHLRTLGVGPDVRVGICLERSPEMIIGLLAAMKAGGAYVPMDPSYPIDRLHYMVTDCAPAVVLTKDNLVARLGVIPEGVNVPVIDLSDRQIFAGHPASNLSVQETGVNPHHLAYVIYTSGSTGLPKGVMVEHIGLCSQVLLHKEDLEAGPGSRVIQFSSFSFDGCVFEVVMALCSGAELHLPDAGLPPMGEALERFVQERGITHAILPAAVLASLPDSINLDSVRVMMSVGDALSEAVAKKWSEGRRFFNGYGPTESTVCTTLHECVDVQGNPPAGNPPIGKPIVNITTYVLDAQLQPVPIGVPGELYIGGIGVARGYLNRPELTAERFLPDPFSAKPGARMYKSGDMARWRTDGTIEFMGRNDFQVKIRGFRIELGEIEAKLLEMPGIKEAAVIAREDVPGTKRLVAYLIPAENSANIQAEALRSHLSANLPEYMIPAAFVTMEAFPLTPNGKLDRRSLPAPEDDAYAVREYIAPIGEAEFKLSEIWKELLGLDKVGRFDNFFELGGHSLMAVSLIERMRAKGLQAEVRAIFAAPTLAELALASEGEVFQIVIPENLIPENCTAITPEMLPLVDLTQQEIDLIVQATPGGAANIQDIYPLAPLQEGIFFHYLMGGTGDAYLTPFMFSFTKRQEMDSFLDGLQAVADRHDTMRTAMFWEGLSGPVQVVRRKAALIKEDIVLDPALSAEDQLRERFDPRHFRLDLRKAPMMQLNIAEDTQNGRWLLQIMLHHLVGDHTAMEVAEREIAAYLAGEMAQLLEATPYRNLVFQALHGVSQEDHEAFFKKMLSDVDEPTAPFGLMDIRGDGGGIAEAHLEVEGALAQRIRERTRRLGVSAASLYHQAWAKVLATLTGKQDVVFGTVLFGRMQGGEGSDRGIGLFINTLPVRITIGDEDTESHLRNTHRLLADLMRHEHAPLALAQKCSAIHSTAPLFTTIFNFRHSEIDEPEEAEGGEQASAENNADGGDSPNNADSMEQVYFEERTNYPLSIAVDDLGADFLVTIQVHDSVRPESLCALMQKALEALTSTLESAPSRPVSQLDILPDADRALVLEQWNATSVAFSDNVCVHQLFEAKAAQTPDSIAVVQGDERLSYRELNERANRLAHRLVSMGLKPDTRVGICLERSLEMVVGLLGVIKAGGAYVPMDPNYPMDRLRHMLRDSEPMALLTREGKLPEGLLEDGVLAEGKTLPILDLCESFDDQPTANLNPAQLGLRPDHLAYVIYTSGSTGLPKGVMLEHRGACNLVEAQIQGFHVEPSSKVLQFASFSFDACVSEVLVTLCQGAELVLPEKGALLVGEALVNTLQNYGITHVTLPPAVLSALPEGMELGSVQVLVTAGDAVSESVVKRWIQGRCFINAYGPTETTVCATMHECSMDETGNPPIGKPIQNTSIYILDAQLKPVPVGIPGEIHIGGAGVARGYLNRPELTAERFLPNPFARSGSPESESASRALPEQAQGSGDLGAGTAGAGSPESESASRALPEQAQGSGDLGAGTAGAGSPESESASRALPEQAQGSGDLGAGAAGAGSPESDRLYKTGDMGRWRQDGTIEFMGRNDFQVKIRGFRIELGEIEARLLELPGIKEAAVIARQDGFGGQATSAQADKRLVAYVVPDPEAAQKLDSDVIRKHLEARLPDYMVPAAFVPLEALPLTPNGKLDRKALPAPDFAFAAREYVEPVGNYEITLANIWKEVLGLDKVGRFDNFFELGGHSLMTVRVISRLRQEMGVEVPLGDFFDRPVLAEFAAGITGAALAKLPPITPTERGKRIPLSFAQQRLWFIAQIDGASEAYHMPSGLRLTGNLDKDALRRALDRIVYRHEALRTTFAEVDGESSQIITPAESARFQLLEQTADSEEMLERLTEEEFSMPFDLTRGPLVRGRLIKESEDSHILLVTMHHIVSDGWSMGLLVNEFNTLYNAYSQGQEDPLPPLAVQYADYAIWQREQAQTGVLAEQVDYWKQRLVGAPELLDLPTDRPRPAEQDFSGASMDFELDEELSKDLRELSRRNGVTMFMTMMTAWGALLSRMSGQDEVLLGTPSANRGRREIEDLIGFFLNTLVMRLDLTGNPTVKDALQLTKARSIEAQANQDVPFEHVVEVVNPARNMAHSPLFQVMFVWQNNEAGELEMSGSDVEGIQNQSHSTSTFDMSLEMEEVEDGIIGNLEYATALFNRESMENLVEYFKQLLRGMVISDAQPIHAIPVLPELERQHVLEGFNATGKDFPGTTCLAQNIFEAQAKNNPTAVALIEGNISLTYGELNARANRLAHHLRGLGVKAESRVALCVPKSIEMMTAVLAVLKAGGAYIPMDHTYPTDRLQHMLQDSGPIALLAKQDQITRLQAELPEALTGLQIVDLAQTFDTLPDGNLDPAAVDLTADSLAYVCYTSGSTGIPKGVMIEHRALWNLCHANQNVYGFRSDDRFLQFIPYNFDGSIEEIYGAFKVGAPLILRGDDWSLDASSFWQQIRDHQITIVDLPTRFWQMLAFETAIAIPDCLRMVLIYGEAVEERALQVWFNRKGHLPRLFNTYGPTETTVNATVRELTPVRSNWKSLGGPLDNIKLYVLNGQLQPVPVGVTGELYIGGSGVARGYLNRPELNEQSFLPNPFVGAGSPERISASRALPEQAQGSGDVSAGSGAAAAAAGSPESVRLYKTGDLVKWLPDGTIQFIGRNDFQVKIRGFRIELGEVEAKLSEMEGVRETIVIAREDVPGIKQLVAYFTADTTLDLDAFRTFLSGRLPDYMVPAAFVQMDALPLTPNGKVDRRRLPAPEGDAYSRKVFEAPQGKAEEAIAAIWSELLQREQISRFDNFFELGGHSLLAMTLIERMRRQGLEADVRAIFASPTLADLASAVTGQSRVVKVPENLIPEGCTEITPAMLPLIQLTEQEIQAIQSATPGGAANIQDIYPLAPLQEGFLFHYLASKDADPFLLPQLLIVESREQIDAFVKGLQAVVARHDILRTAIQWEGLSEPVQVVWRKAPFELEEIALDESQDAEEQMRERFESRRDRLDLRRAPMMKVCAAFDAKNERWIMVVVMHHLTGDQTTFSIMQEEILAILQGREQELPEPIPYRNMVAQARLGVSVEEHEAFFRAMLSDVEEPTAPFGFLEVQGDGSGIQESRLELDMALNQRMRAQARRVGVGAATLCHQAWAMVLARLTGREDVVFGTLLFGRMQGGEGTDRAIGLFLNTLPIRIKLDTGNVEASVRNTQKLLADLMYHEHASLALAQRCSSVHAPMPLFTAPLNVRHEIVAQPSAAEALLIAEEEAMMAAAGMGEGVLCDAAGDEDEDPWEGMEGLKTEERGNYPLSLDVDDNDEDGMLFIVQSVEGIDPRYVAQCTHRAMEKLVEALETHPSMPIREVDILPEGERQQLLEAWNATGKEYPGKTYLAHEIFESQAENNPAALALVEGNISLTYGELNERANRLAHHLRSIGVKPDACVALCVPKSISMMVAMLAVLKAGGAYIPMDTTYPADRMTHILKDSAPMALLAHAEQIQRLESEVAEALKDIALVDLAQSLDNQPSGNPDPAAVGLTADHLAYVCYTSGSTGVPKGVMIEHRAVWNLCHANQDVYGFTSEDRFLQFVPYHFDGSIEEIYGAFKVGAPLILRGDDWSLDASSFWAKIRQHQITILDLPTRFWQMLAMETAIPVPECVRMVLIYGEAVEERALQVWFSRSGHVPRLFNTYGPTEGTVNATLRELTRDSENWKSLGGPLANVKLYVLNAQMQPAPAGVPGELYIGGMGVARGYLNRPELNAIHFLNNPFAEGRLSASRALPEQAQGSGDVSAGAAGAGSPERIYKTGDLVSWLPDGTLKFVGRTDFQVKIRGFRIELGEIEARLLEMPGIKEAAVIARQDQPGNEDPSASSDKRLVAYVVPAPGFEISMEAVKEHLTLNLPEYMVPSAFMSLEALPLTPNGKLDRKALPAPDSYSQSTKEYVEPKGEVEEKLAAIWVELLHVEKVGRFDNFFELGGHSLLAMTLMERMRQQELHTDIMALFANPTLSALARSLGGASSTVEAPENLIPEGCTAITPEMLTMVTLTQGEIDHIVSAIPGGAENVQDIYPLAPLQEGILFHHMMENRGDAYLIPIMLAFDSKERLDAFTGTMQSVINRHDILRTSMAWESLPEPVQVVWRKASLVIEHVEDLDPEQDIAEQDIAEKLKDRFDPSHYRIDVRQAPMLRLCIAQDAKSGSWLLLVLLHHLIGDHTTMEVVSAEIQAFLQGQGDQLPEAAPYRNLVAQARLGVSKEEHEAFFTQMLKSVDESTAPFGLTETQHDGSGIAEGYMEVDEALAMRIQENARRLGVSAATIFHQAWAQVLALATGREDVVFGTVMFGRMQGGAGANRAIGLFINTLPIKISVNGESIEQSVKKTQQLLAQLMHHEHAPLALAQRCSSVQAPAPLFTTLFNYRHNPALDEEDGEWEGEEESEDEIMDGPDAQEESTEDMEDEGGDEGGTWEGTDTIYDKERTNFPLHVAVDDYDGFYTIKIQVLESLDPMQLASLVHEAALQIVTALEQTPALPARNLYVMPALERVKVMETFNATAVNYPTHLCVHELFEAEAAKNPEATALVFGEDELSYGALNASANRLAHYLRSHGVTADSRVAICVERGFDMIVGLLAILKAGGAYVPLDPAYPVERLALMLEDSQADIVLTQLSMKGILPPSVSAQLNSPEPEAPVSGAPSPRALCMDRDAELWSKEPDTNPTPMAKPENLVYVIFTSGSTGRPKGVAMIHRAVVNLLFWQNQRSEEHWHMTGGTGQIRTLQFTPISFDVSFQEIFATLGSGNILVLAEDEVRRDPSGLLHLLQDQEINRLFLPFVALQQMADMAGMEEVLPETLREIITAGEQLKATNSLRELLGALPDCRLENQYGPTESHVVTAYTLSDDVEEWEDLPPIGTPIANTQIYILDKALRPVPQGVPGEIYIAGVALARDYLNRPELTADRFIPNPFAGAGSPERMSASRALPEQAQGSGDVSAGAGAAGAGSPERMYKTGDMGCWRVDGNIEFMERNDFQVKIRGFRVELGEIETRLMEHEAVRDAIVMAREDAPGVKRLVAYYKSAQPMSAEDMKAFLSGRLPEYMVPSAFVKMEAFPLTPSGKVDRKALPAPDGSAFAKTVYEAPQGEVENQLAEMWSELLKVDNIGRNDNFFDLGGHSLLVTRLLLKLQTEFDVEIDLRDVFGNAQLSQLARRIRQAQLEQYDLSDLEEAMGDDEEEDGDEDGDEGENATHDVKE